MRPEEAVPRWIWGCVQAFADFQEIQEIPEFPPVFCWRISAHSRPRREGSGWDFSERRSRGKEPRPQPRIAVPRLRQERASEFGGNLRGLGPTIEVMGKDLRVGPKS